MHLKISYLEDSSVDNYCMVLVQDQNFNTILRVEYNKLLPQDLKRYTKISNDIESIRICMQSRERNPALLPESIILEQITIH